MPSQYPSPARYRRHLIRHIKQLRRQRGLKFYLLSLIGDNRPPRVSRSVFLHNLKTSHLEAYRRYLSAV